MRNSVVLVWALTTLWIGNLQAEDNSWTGWLGPQRNGWVMDFEPPSAWPAKLNRRWQVEVGEGYGSPLVEGNRVYQHARLGEEEVVWSIDLDTGEVNWQERHSVPFKIGGGAEFHGKGPKSSPVLSGSRLLTMSITGDLSAWDSETGRLLWRTDYGTRFDTNHPYWGAATSPIALGNKVIAHFGNDEEGALIALDVGTGEELWSLDKDPPSYSSPLIVKFQGYQQLVEWNHRALVGIDLEKGSQLWEYPFPHVGSDQNMPTPTFYKGRIILGGENRGIHCLEPQQVASGGWDVQARWHVDQLALDMSSAVINEDLLYGFSHYDKGRIFCLDPETGKIRWESPGRTGDNVMFLSLPGFIAALINDGELQIIKATPESYQKVASYRVSQDPTWAPPVILTNGILVKDKRSLSFWSFDE